MFWFLTLTQFFFSHLSLLLEDCLFGERFCGFAICGVIKCVAEINVSGRNNIWGSQNGWILFFARINGCMAENYNRKNIDFFLGKHLYMWIKLFFCWAHLQQHNADSCAAISPSFSWKWHRCSQKVTDWLCMITSYSPTSKMLNYPFKMQINHSTASAVCLDWKVTLRNKSQEN